VPAAAREFSRNERLLIRLPVYTAGAAPEVSARLVSRFGGVMRELAVTRADAGDWYQVDVPLAGLAMGDYTVEFSASTADGRVNDRVAIRVTS
jgi:hypothetical protein